MQDLLDDERLLQNIMIPGNSNKPVMDNGLASYDVYNLRFMEYNYPVITPTGTDIDGEEEGEAVTATDVIILTYLVKMRMQLWTLLQLELK